MMPSYHPPRPTPPSIIIIISFIVIITIIVIIIITTIIIIVAVTLQWQPLHRILSASKFIITWDLSKQHFQIFKEKKEACHNKGAFDIFASMGHILWDICDMLCCRLFWVGAPLALLRLSVTTGREEHPNLLAFASSMLHVSLLPFYHWEVGEVWATSHEQKTFRQKKIISLVLVNLCCLQSDFRHYTPS